jgi:Zn-dependent protease with chaperone function
MDSLEAARALLPWWVGWSNILIYIPAVFIASLVIARLSAMIALLKIREHKESHWVERARAGQPARRVVILNCILLPVLFAPLTPLWEGPFARVTGSTPIVLAVLAAFFGAYLSGFYVDRTLRSPGLSLGRWLRGQACVWLVYRTHVLIIPFVVLFMPREINVRAVLVMIGGSVAFALAARGGGLIVARWLGWAWPASPRLLAVVETATARTGVRPRVVYEIGWNIANALAFPFGRQLAFTAPLVEILSDEELAAVTAHELGHLAEPRRVLLARLAGPYVAMALVAVTPLLGVIPWEFLLPLFAVPLITVILLRRMARRMEERADAVAKTHEGDSGTYARALEKLYEYNLTPAVTESKRTIHPHLYDRLISAGIEPDYPRPLPPPRRAGTFCLILSLFLAIAVNVGLLVARTIPVVFMPNNEPAQLWGLAAINGRAEEVCRLARLRLRDGDLEGAAALYRAACEMEDAGPGCFAGLAIALARLDRCDEASAAIRRAVGGLRADPGRGFNSNDAELIGIAMQTVRECRALKSQEAQADDTADKQ